MIGLAVGIVSSMLGVAGGELLIPTIIFVFGADIRIAGTASLLISIAIVGTGLYRNYKIGALNLSVRLHNRATSALGSIPDLRRLRSRMRVNDKSNIQCQIE